MAEFLAQQGAQGSVRRDLAQLFRRVAFNMNPSVDKAEHVLNIGEADNRSDLRAVIDTAGW